MARGNKDAITAVAAVAGVGVLGVGLYFLYDYLSKGGGGECVDGQFYEEQVCADQSKIYKKICVGGELKDTGQYCEEEPIPQVDCIDGARKCVQNRALQCQNKAWVDIGSCDTLGCPSCASASYWCEGASLLYDYQCDPYSVPRECNYTMYRTTDPLCTNRVPNKMRVSIDNSYSTPGTALGLEIYPEGNCCSRGQSPPFCSYHAIYPVNKWAVEVQDRFNDPIANADVWIVALNRCKTLFIEYGTGLLVDPFEYQTGWNFGDVAHCGPFPKGSPYFSKTDSNGIVRGTSMGILDPGTNLSRVESFRVYVSRDGITLYQDVNLRYFGQNGNGSSTSCISHYNYDPWGCTY